VLSLQFLEALQSLLGYFPRILHDISYCPCFYALWSQVFSLRSLITTAELSSSCAPLYFSCLSFMRLFSHLACLRMVTPRPRRCWVRHKGEAVAIHIEVLSLHPLAKGLARWRRQSPGLGTGLFCTFHGFPRAQSRIFLFCAKQTSLIK